MFLQKPKKAINTIMVIIISLAFIGGLIFLKLNQPNFIPSINHIITHYRLVFTLFRWGLLIGLFILWPRIIQYLAKKNNWTIEKVNFFVQRKAKLSVWLILFELMINENIIFILFHSLDKQ